MNCVLKQHLNSVTWLGFGEIVHLGKVVLGGAHVQALFNLGNLQRQLGNFTAALGHYEAVLERDPGHARAHLNRAVTLLGLGRAPEARCALDAAMQCGGNALVVDFLPPRPSPSLSAPISPPTHSLSLLSPVAHVLHLGDQCRVFLLAVALPWERMRLSGPGL